MVWLDVDMSLKKQMSVMEASLLCFVNSSQGRLRVIFFSLISFMSLSESLWVL